MTEEALDSWVDRGLLMEYTPWVPVVLEKPVPVVLEKPVPVEEKPAVPVVVAPVKTFEPPTVTRAADDMPILQLIDFDYFVTKDDGVRKDFQSDTQGLLVPVPPVRRRLVKSPYRMLGPGLWPG